MGRSLPPLPPPQPPPPKEAVIRGYKFVWRVLLISNLALGGFDQLENPLPLETEINGSLCTNYLSHISWKTRLAYIFTRPRKKETAKKDKKHTELPSAPEIKTIPDSEGVAATPDYEPEKMQVPVREDQWSKPFKW